MTSPPKNDTAIITAAMEAATGGNRTLFAEQLGVSLSTVFRWLRKGTNARKPVLDAKDRRLMRWIARDPEGWGRTVKLDG